MSVNNLGTVLHERGRFEEAIECCRRVLREAGICRGASQSGHAALIAGAIRGRMAQYKWRHRTPGFTRDPRRFDQPRWMARRHRGRESRRCFSIRSRDMGTRSSGFVMCRARSSGAGTSCWNASRRWCDGCNNRAAWAQTIIPRGSGGGPVPIPFDVQLPLASLPLTLGEIDPRQPARPVGAYLTADADSRTSWRARLASDGEGLKIGLVWSGSPMFTNNRLRSTTLAALRR